MLYLGWASFFVLQAVCILCAITYVAVIAIFIISGGATSFPMTTLPGRAPRDAPRRSSDEPARARSLALAGRASALVSRDATPSRARRTPSSRRRPGAGQLPPLTDQQKVEIAKWWDVQPKVERAGAEPTAPRC